MTITEHTHTQALFKGFTSRRKNLLRQPTSPPGLRWRCSAEPPLAWESQGDFSLVLARRRSAAQADSPCASSLSALATIPLLRPLSLPLHSPPPFVNISATAWASIPCVRMRHSLPNSTNTSQQHKNKHISTKTNTTQHFRNPQWKRPLLVHQSHEGVDRVFTNDIPGRIQSG